MILRSWQRRAGVHRALQLAWLAWLGQVLPVAGALGEEPGQAAGEVRPDATTTHRARVRQAAQAEPDKRSDSRTLAASTALGTARGKSSERQLRRRARTTADPRLADLAATRGKVADVSRLHGVAPIEPAGPMAAAAEHRIRVQAPSRPIEPARPTSAPVAPAVTALDEGIVKEIGQRKVLFRMCYESARRRGVLATRADVKWVLAADGSVHDVEVAVDQDAQLANCIRVVASRPYAGRVGQDMPVAIPLLFVSTR